MKEARRIATALCLAAVSAIGIAACDGDQYGMQYKRGVPDVATTEPAMSDAPAKGGARNDESMRDRSLVLQAAPPPAPALPQPAPGNMIIRNGMVSIMVDSLETAMDAVRKLATSLGGYVGNVSINTGEHQVRSATLQLKIPAPRFNDAFSGMSALGEVEHRTETAEDVGEEFVDVTTRIENGKRLEARLVSLLASRAGSLEDVLAVERELARVRSEIERYEGRIRYLSSRIAMSEIAVTVHERAPLVSGNPGTNVIVQAFRNLWRNFVQSVAFLIELVGVAVPAGLVIAGVYLAVRRWKRRAVTT